MYFTGLHPYIKSDDNKKYCDKTEVFVLRNMTRILVDIRIAIFTQ
jgi:hypothetical protein